MSSDLKTRILGAGLSSNGYSTVMTRLDMIRTGYGPELAKRNIQDADVGPSREYLHIDVFSLRGAGQNAQALLGTGKKVGPKEFVRLLNLQPARRREINPFGTALYALSTSRAPEWGTGVKQASPPFFTPPLCPEMEAYVQYKPEGANYKDLYSSVVGILYDSVVMHLEDCEESELKRVLMSSSCPLIAVQSKIIRLEKPYLWRDVSMSSQCTGYISGVAGKPGLATWEKAKEFVIANSRHFLAIRETYNPNTN